MPVPGWIVGLVAATAALVVLASVSLGLYASGGGLMIAAGVAFWVGAGLAGIADPGRWSRNIVVVAAYVVVLLASYLILLQFQTPPAGTSFGGPSVPRP